MRFTKADIEVRARGVAAVNVKLWRTHDTRLPDPELVMEYFQCDQPTAERALQLYEESERAQFWEAAEGLVTDLFGPQASVSQDGRCGGWLLVYGLPPVETWDAIRVARWGAFTRLVYRDIAYRCEWRTVRDAIEVNRWAEPGAEQFNFARLPDGQTRCLTDIKREVRERVPGGALVLR
jgi:hypothetical protein